MSDPRYPSAFQRPGSATPDGTGNPHPKPAPTRSTPPESADPASATTAHPGVAEPVPQRRPRASARPTAAQGPAPGGNRIVLLGGDVDDLAAEAPASRRNRAVGGLYALAAVLLALALLGGLWSQGLLRSLSEYGTTLNPDGLQELYFDGTETGTVGFARLLVQLAPTTLALGVLALLVAIALPVLTRRPR